MSVSDRASMLIQEIAAYRDQIKATRSKLYDLGLILVRCERELEVLRRAAPDEVSDLIEDAALVEDASSGSALEWSSEGMQHSTHH